ncbi:MAG: hypothetical protein ACYTGN_07960 [Planctomycetota bacterium]
MRTFLIALLATACACGGGSDDSTTNTDANAAGNGNGSGEPAALTAQDVLEACVSTDLADFAQLFELLGGLLDGNAESLPEPQIDFGKLLTERKVGWSFDLDEDGTADVSGTLFFTDASGAVVVPFSALDLLALIAAPPENPLDLLEDVPAGTDLNLTWSFDNLPLTTSDAASSGDLVFGIADGQLDSASGSAALTMGDCQFDFSFDEITIDLANPTLPAADATFTVDTADHTVAGKATFDGTSGVTFEATLDDGEAETFSFDISEGLATG